MNCPQLSASPQNALQVGVVSAWKRAQFNYASGTSCEQAIFAAFASDMGLSLIGAQQAAPKRKDRGTGCGALISGIVILEPWRASARQNKTTWGQKTNPFDRQSGNFEDLFLRNMVRQSARRYKEAGKACRTVWT